MNFVVRQPVPWEALRMALRKPGVPEQLVQIVKSFHEGMEAKVRVCNELLDDIQVRNGLRQMHYGSITAQLVCMCGCRMLAGEGGGC